MLQASYDMRNCKTFSLMIIIILLVAWHTPVLAQKVQTSCSCCLKMECCCGCKENTREDALPLEPDDISKARHCTCSISAPIEYYKLFTCNRLPVQKELLSFYKRNCNDNNKYQQSTQNLFSVKHFYSVDAHLFLFTSSFLL